MATQDIGRKLHHLRRMMCRGCGKMERALAVLLFFVLQSAAAAPFIELDASSVEFVPIEGGDAPDSSFYARYPYVVIIDEGDDDEVTDGYFYQYAASVIFKVSKWDLPKDDKTLKELRETVLPQISRDSLKIVRVRMRGAASPEGPESFNKQLSENRQQALYDYIKDFMQIPQGDSLQFETETEDYQYLYKRMLQDGDPDCERVKDIFDSYMPHAQYAELKKALQKLDGGRVWRRLLVSYFPSLRAARMVIVCQRKPVPHVEPVPAPEPEPPVVRKPEPEPETWVERYPRRELLSVKTNLLGYVGYMPNYNRYCPIPNVAVEYYPLHGHFTFGASFDCPWWQHYHKQKFFQIRNYQIETRYYFRSGDIELRPEGEGAAFRGLYLQAYAHAACYGICFDEKRGWEGEAYGGGVGVGYVLPLSKKGHWRLEFQLQVGFFAGPYDPYQYEYDGWEGYPHDDLYYYDYYGDPDLFKKRQHRFTWFGPTRVGITLSYDLLYRKARKKTNGVRMPKDTKPTVRYNPLVPYENHEKGGRQ